MIEYEFTDFIKLQKDIIKRKGTGTIIACDNVPSLKLGWKLVESDEIWTIRVKHLRKINIRIKIVKYVCC